MEEVINNILNDPISKLLEDLHYQLIAYWG